MQRGERVLEDHPDLAAADPAHPVVGQGQQVLAVEADLARDVGVGRPREPHHREVGHALAGAGLAHDPQHPTAVDAERDSVHRPDQPVVGLEVDDEVPHLQQAAHRYLTRGSMKA